MGVRTFVEGLRCVRGTSVEVMTWVRVEMGDKTYVEGMRLWGLLLYICEAMRWGWLGDGATTEMVRGVGSVGIVKGAAFPSFAL